MKKYTFKNLLICTYICTVVYLCYGYFYNGPLKVKGFYKFLESYFGISIFVIGFIALLHFSGLFIRCTKRRTVYNVRLLFLIILIISSVIVHFAGVIGIPYEKVTATPEQLHKMTEIGLYRYKMGLFPVFLLDWIYDRAMGLYIYVAGYVLIAVSSFFLFARAVRITIMWIINSIRRKIHERRARILYEEQKRLEEYYRKLDMEKELARQKQLELEREIEKERELMEQIGEEEYSDEYSDVDEESEEIQESDVKEVVSEEEHSDENENSHSTEEENSDGTETESSAEKNPDLCTQEEISAEEKECSDDEIRVVDEDDPEVKINKIQESEDMDTGIGELSEDENFHSDEQCEVSDGSFEASEESEFDKIKKLAQTEEEITDDTGF